VDNHSEEDEEEYMPPAKMNPQELKNMFKLDPKV
jgi:hypothetical protein